MLPAPERPGSNVPSSLQNILRGSTPHRGINYRTPAASTEQQEAFAAAQNQQHHPPTALAPVNELHHRRRGRPADPCVIIRDDLRHPPGWACHADADERFIVDDGAAAAAGGVGAGRDEEPLRAGDQAGHHGVGRARGHTAWWGFTPRARRAPHE